MLTSLIISACVNEDKIRAEIPAELEPTIEYVDRYVYIQGADNNSLIQTYGDIMINDFKLYNKTYGVCEAYYETIFYENDTHFWKVGFRGCDSDGEFSDYYYLLVDRIYVPIEIAIEEGYITFEEFEQSNLGTKIEK